MEIVGLIMSFAGCLIVGWNERSVLLVVLGMFLILVGSAMAWGMLK